MLNNIIDCKNKWNCSVDRIQRNRLPDLLRNTDRLQYHGDGGGGAMAQVDSGKFLTKKSMRPLWGRKDKSDTAIIVFYANLDIPLPINILPLLHSTSQILKRAIGQTSQQSCKRPLFLIGIAPLSR